MNKIQGIYCIENIKNGKKYYGSSLDVVRRLQRHKRKLKRNNHENQHLQNAVNKYGINSFRFYQIEKTDYDTRQKLFEREQVYIDDNIDGYNISSAAACGTTTRIDNPLIGRKHSENVRAKCRTDVEEIPKEQRDKIIASNKNNTKQRTYSSRNSNKKSCPQRGHSPSDQNKDALRKFAKLPKTKEHLDNLSKSLCEFWSIPGNIPANSVGVMVDGKEYSSMTEACRETNINLSTLRNRCLSKNPAFINTYRLDRPKLRV
jgi:group I intron endonuclease